MELDLESCPPVPPEHYEIVRQLILSDQMRVSRVVAILSEDEKFHDWFMAQRKRETQ